MTVVLTESELLVGSRSGVVEAIDAVLVNEAALFGAVTTIVNVVDAPDAQVDRVQVTDVLALLLHDHPPLDGVTDTKFTPAGNVSTTLRLSASEGPRFRTVTSYVTVPPAVTEPGPSFVTARSADGVTLVVTLSALLDGSGSAVVEVMATVLVNDAACGGAVTTTVNVVDAPEFQFARVHVTEVLPLLLHNQPPFDGLTDTKLTPAGSVSASETLEASDGPLLEAVMV